MTDSLGNIVIIGATGSGKTTLGRRLAARTNRHPIDLDDYHWQPGWIGISGDVFRNRLATALDAVPGNWVASGNYREVKPLLWGRAHTVVALDYSAQRVFWQLFCRTMRRSWTGELVCNGNRETFAKAFLNRDSILLWFFKSFWRRRRELAALLADPGDYAHLRILRFKHPKETEQWLMTL